MGESWHLSENLSFDWKASFQQWQVLLCSKPVFKGHLNIREKVSMLSHVPYCCKWRTHHMMSVGVFWRLDVVVSRNATSEDRHVRRQPWRNTNWRFSLVPAVTFSFVRWHHCGSAVRASFFRQASPPPGPEGLSAPSPHQWTVMMVTRQSEMSPHPLHSSPFYKGIPHLENS